MQAFMNIRIACFLVIALVLCSSTLQASADVRVAMAGDLEKCRNFLVAMDIYYHKPEGVNVKKFDSSFLTAGGTKNINVLAVWPFLYHHVSTHAFHPAYYPDRVNSHKIPFALRTVDLPPLRPQSWRHLLDRREPPKGVDGGIIPAVVDRHFHQILAYYLPAFDRARIQEDLRQYLPLLNEVAAFALREPVFRKSEVGGDGRPGSEAA